MSQPTPYDDSVANGDLPLSDDDPTHLRRGLRARQVTMIALGGALGSGLLIGTGSALANAGPGSIFISYSIVGFLVWVVLCSLGEMAAWLPLESGFTGYAARFVDPALGFSLGYTYWFKYIITTPNQLTACSLVLQYWVDRDRVNPGVFIAVFLVVIIVINYCGVRYFGEIEFWLSSAKVLTMVGLILLSLILMLGGGPNHDRKGFRYWNNPGAFKARYKSTYPHPQIASPKLTTSQSRISRQLPRPLEHIRNRNIRLPRLRTRRRHRRRSPKPAQSHSPRHQTHFLADPLLLRPLRPLNRLPRSLQLQKPLLRHKTNNRRICLAFRRRHYRSWNRCSTWVYQCLYLDLCVLGC